MRFVAGKPPPGKDFSTMRLTLRTMLAYMDDILEPNDSAEIGQKIEESEFASNLYNRTRDVIRRMRLGAPQVLGRGMGQDANTVAEYLDNTMPSERVAEFEKVCLESDVHLAETAACHQVLTLVLGQPADVSRVSRERMYRIPEMAEHAPSAAAIMVDQPHEPPVDATAVAANTTAAAPPAAKPKAKPEVPDYLRQSARARRRRQAIVMILVLTLVGLGSLAFVRPDLLGLPTDVASVADPSAPTEEPAYGAAAAVAENSHESAPPLAEPIRRPADERPAAAVTNLLPPESVERATPDAEPVESPLALPPSEPVGPAAEPLATDKPEEPLALPAAIDGPGEASEEPVAVSPEPGHAATDSSPIESAAAADVQVGVYVPDKNVLLRFDRESNAWKRLQPRAPIFAGDHLLSLPTFRPTVTLSDGITMQLGGGTSITLDAPDADGRLGLKMHYGRVLLLAAGRGGGELRLLLDDKQQYLGFADANALLAIEAHRTLEPGADPTAAPAPLHGMAYVASGAVIWDAPNGPLEVQGPAMWALPAGIPDPQAQVGALPDWINSEELSLTDKIASQALETALALDRSISLSLAELVDGRRSEVRGLAVRGSVHVGQFEPFVAALSDLDQRGTWDTHIETLREALALSPQVAAQVREALQHKRGTDDGEQLFRLLWSYSDEQLKAGSAAELVALLKHDQRDFRVLASWNLNTITGLGPEYRPEYSEARHQRTVDRWRERLEAGEIHWPTDEDANVPPTGVDRSSLVP
ncbi:MAG: hypothetical protein KDA42_05565 [Planctomycetales bacterium]|nr:hypothetical protein [Planctomycetales bacterium]